VRSLREDRTIEACNNLIKDVIGEEFTYPVADHISDIFAESHSRSPILYLISNSQGSDIEDQIENFAK
jgi:hypothetical protein